MPSKLKVKSMGKDIIVSKVGGGSIATKKTRTISVNPDKVLKHLATDRKNAEFRVRVARVVQNKHFVPAMDEFYRHFLDKGLRYVLSNRMRNFGDVDHSGPIQFSVGSKKLVVRRGEIPWMSHSAEYRKQLKKRKGSSKSLIRNTGRDTHANNLMRELLSDLGVSKKLVVGNPLKRDYKGTAKGTLDIAVSAYINYKLKRPEYDAYVKLAFTEGVLHRSLLGGYDGIKDIGILNAFELGHGGPSGSFSRRRQRPIIGELARAYGKATGEVYRAKLKSLR